MTTITNIVKDAAGAPVPDTAITARLVAPSGFLTSGGEIVKEATTVSGQDGTWTLTLTPVSALAYPTGAHYVVTEGVRRHTITVPDSGSHELASVLVDVPTERGTVGLTLTAGDARYDPIGTATAGDAAHEADTTAVHGIADTSALETVTGAAAKVTAHAGATDPHGDRADAASLYLPLTGGTLDGSLSIASSFAGGEDEGQPGQFDSTGRLNLESYQRADFNSYGEVLRIYSRRADSKQMVAWYGPESFDGTTREPIGTDKPWFWMGAHYEANDHGSTHGHWSCEVPDTTGALQTRLEFKIWDPLTGVYGMDKTNILTNAADLTIRTTNGQVLRLSSPVAHHKDIQFGLDHDGADAFQRWRIRVTSTTSDFQLLRYNDAGTLQDTPLAVSRSTGKVTIGGASGTSQGLDVLRSGGTTMNVTQSGAGATALNLFGADTAVRAFQAQVTGDAFGRYAVMATGETQWGSGAAGRDTNLYRSAADTLKTDDAFHVGTQFRHLGSTLGFYNATAVAKQTITGSRAIPEQALSGLLTALATLGLITNSTTA